MSRIAIVTDSTVNLPAELVEKYHLTIIPMTLIWGHETFRDMIDIQPQAFYERLATDKVFPTTSQATPAEFIHAFSRLLESYRGILVITLSSKLSGTMESAIQARQSFSGAPIELFDSEMTSLPMGFQVMAAAEAALQGASLAECKRAAEAARPKTGVYFVVDTLEFLHRGGRIGGAARFLGTALNLKPILWLKDGRVEPLERVRTQKRSLERVLDLVEEQITGSKSVKIGILDANAPEQAEILAQQAMTRFKPSLLLRSAVSPVIGAHTGPGTLGIGFMKD